MNELLWVVMLLINFAAIMISYRFWGKIGLFLWIPISVIIANIQVTKTIELFGIEATLGNIVYATSFLATDILNENYSRRDAARAVGMGFFALLFMTAAMNLAVWFIPAESDFVHDSMKNLFSLMPRIAVGSLAAYGISQMHDIWAYSFWKKRKPEKKFIWIRNNASTMISQLIDTIIFTSIAFIGVFPLNVLVQIAASTYLLKWLVAAADTPFIYLAKRMKDKGIVP
ncbi:MAG: queuosine precursor transporter [Spirochaetia bacterium]|nr:queuosine precursor transporter [Spirochaetia bacterium]